jgi:AcrR family transcriptional regulator
MKPAQQPETRHKILAAAEQNFRRFGPKKTSMEEIAETAGLSRATLYLHFASKPELYEALLRQVTERFITEIELLVTSDKPAPLKFRQLVDLTANTYTANPLLLAALTEDNDYALTRHAGPVMSDYRTQILGAIRRILDQGVVEGSVRKIDVDVTAYLLYELGTQLLVKALNGSSEYALKTTLDVMDSIVADGIRFDKKKVKAT